MEMMCPRCEVVYDVVGLGNYVWRVINNNPRLITAFFLDEAVPLDFDSCNQLQSAKGPMCLDRECVLSDMGGYLSDAPIPLDLTF